MKFIASLWRTAYTASCFVYVFIGGAILSLFYCPFIVLFYRNDQVKINLKTRKAISICFRCMLNLAKVVGAFDVKVKDLDKVLNDKGLVVVANHPSFIDYVMLAAMISDLNCIVKKEMANNIMFRYLLKCAGYISNEDSEDKLEEIKSYLNRGDKLLIFPEGTRTKDENNLKIKRGVAHLALRCPCSIRVLSIRCNEKFLTKNNGCFDLYPKKPVFTITSSKLISKDYIINTFGQEPLSLGARHLTKELEAIMKHNIREVIND